MNGSSRRIALDALSSPVGPGKSPASSPNGNRLADDCNGNNKYNGINYLRSAQQTSPNVTVAILYLAIAPWL